jgi:hypothetical protein
LGGSITGGCATGLGGGGGAATAGDPPGTPPVASAGPVTTPARSSGPGAASAGAAAAGAGCVIAGASTATGRGLRAATCGGCFTGLGASGARSTGAGGGGGAVGMRIDNVTRTTGGCSSSTCQNECAVAAAAPAPCNISEQASVIDRHERRGRAPSSCLRNASNATRIK